MPRTKIRLRQRVLFHCLFAASFLALTQSPLAAQVDGAAVTIGEWRELESEILDETRRVIVYKPSGYDRGEDRYPVMYLLDGGGHFHHTTGIVQFLAANRSMPQMIVVAITNTDRTRDMTPTTSADCERFPTAGGADDFADFIERELAPFVEENYRTSEYRLIVGHSFGGLFVFHALVHRPDIFDSYIAISPSLWWGNQRLVGEFKELIQHSDKLDKVLYATTGNEGGQMLGSLLRIMAILEEKTPEDFRWRASVMKEETHGSIPHRTTYDGLKFVFAGWED